MGSQVVDVDNPSPEPALGGRSVAGSVSGGSNHSTRRTPPNCARCRNHKIKVPLQAHKRYCPYKECACKDCTLTKERQRIMAEQTARRRAMFQDEQRELKLKKDQDRRIELGQFPLPTLPSASQQCIHPTSMKGSSEMETSDCKCNACMIYKNRQQLIALQSEIRKGYEERLARGESVSSSSLPPSTPGSCIDVENFNPTSSGDEDNSSHFTGGTSSPRSSKITVIPSKPSNNVYASNGIRSPVIENNNNGIIENGESGEGVHDDIIWTCIGSVLKEFEFNVDSYSLLFIIMKHFTCDVDKICDMIRSARMKIQCYQAVSTSPNFGFVLPPVVDSSSREYVNNCTHQDSLVKTSYKYPKKKLGTRVKTEGKVQLRSNRPIEFSIEWLQRSSDQQIKESPPSSPTPPATPGPIDLSCKMSPPYAGPDDWSSSNMMRHN
uniref:Protein doublesex n=2 Tax=Cacopsylla melanoneura TaxID=428564 RepID=A0A8D9AZ60_9HEMI